MDFLPIAFLLYYIPITVIVLLVKEWRVRRRVSKNHINPAAWVSLFWIVVPASISLWLSFSIMILWVEAIASF